MTMNISETPSLAASWRVYLQAPSLRMLALGFCAGLPLLLVLGTLSFWLREAGLNLSTIAQLSWVGLAWAFKWAWAPLVDSVALPWATRRLGRRRSWLLLSQVLIAAALLGMAVSDPQRSLSALVWCALAVAFASATQDIALDAWRIESARAQEQAALAAMYQAGYRLGMIWAGAGVLWLAAQLGSDTQYVLRGWSAAYTIMAASMGVGMAVVLMSSEPVAQPAPDVPTSSAHVPVLVRLRQWLQTAVVAPFAQFFHRWGWTQALVLLALVAVYRISDIVMGVMANPFYVDLGFSKQQVAAVTKLYGLLMTLAGAFAGGALAMRLGLMRTLLLGAILSAASNLLFAWLAARGVPDVQALTLVISADNLCGGIATAAFVAYLSSLTQRNYSATQYAMLSSMMVLAPKWLAGFSGAVVEWAGYPYFFIATACLGLPVMALIAWAMHIHAQAEAQNLPHMP